MKKVVVSTNYTDMTTLNPDLAKITGFVGFKPTQVQINGSIVLKKNIVCWCSSCGCFEVFNGQETDLVFIPDTFPSSKISMNLVISKEEDYFLAHASKYSSQRDFAAQFAPNHVVLGHHEQTGEGSNSYHRIVANIMTDGNIAPDQKAEEIIRQIWPEKEMQRATSDRLLESYYSRQEVLTSDDPCPSVFADGGAMEAAFDELKKHKPCTPEFEAAYKKLQDLSYNKYYK